MTFVTDKSESAPPSSKDVALRQSEAAGVGAKTHRVRADRAGESLARKRRRQRAAELDAKACNLFKRAAKAPDARALAAEGLGPCSIAVRLGVNQETVRRWLALPPVPWWGDAVW